MAPLSRKSIVHLAAVVFFAAGAGTALATCSRDAPGDAVRLEEFAVSSTTTTRAAEFAQQTTTTTLRFSDADARVAIIGDDWTKGVLGAGGEGARSWVGVLEQSIRDSGQTTAFKIATVPSGGYASPGEDGVTFENLVDDVIRPDIQTVIVFGSRNDFGLSAEAIGQGARATFQQIRNVLPDIALIVIGPVGLPIDGSTSVQEANEILGVVAAEYEATFIDPQQQGWFAAGHAGLVDEDSGTPTDDGHEHIAGLMPDLVTDRG